MAPARARELPDQTRVIVHRIAYLMARGVHPEAILAVTFTNKAAGEMRERVERLLRMPLTGLWISTLHSSCVRILRQYIDRLGYKRQFVIYDETDRSSLIKTCMQDLRIDDKHYQPRAIIGRISSLKNNLTDPEQFARRSAGFGFDEAVHRTYSLYNERLKESGGIDFDDLLMLTVRLLEQHPDVLAYYQQLIQHVLIDEYQDTNHAQYRIVRLLTAKYKSLCVVTLDIVSHNADIDLTLLVCLFPSKDTSSATIIPKFFNNRICNNSPLVDPCFVTLPAIESNEHTEI